VAQPKIERGWTGVANAAQLKQKIQTENPKNIPPPTAAAATGQVPGGISPTSPPPPGQTGAAPFAPEATQPPGKHKGQFERGVAKPTPEQPGGAANQPPQGQYRGPGSQQTAAPAAGAAPYEGRAGKQKGQGAFAQPSAPPTSGAVPGETRGGKQRGQGAYAQPGGAPGGGPPAGGGQEKPKGGKKKGEQGSPTPPGPQ
jgi:translation initiation factor IF-2